MKLIRKFLLLRIMQTKTWSWLLAKVVPFIRFTMYYTDFPGFKFHEAYNLLQPGDYLVSIDRKKLTTLLIGGDWTHAAMCVSKDQIFEIAELTHKGYTKSTLFDFCKESDRIAIFRPPYDPEYRNLVIEKCKSFSHLGYDDQFTLGVKALYCSELVYESDFMRVLQVDLEDLAGLGRPYISPTGLADCANATCVYDSGAAK